MVDFGDYLRQEQRLRELAKTDAEAFEAYRRHCQRLNIMSNAMNRIARRQTYGSLQEEVDAMRALAVDALRLTA